MSSDAHKIHELIISLGSDCYITTNYDSLIENAFQKFRNGLMLRRVNNDNLLNKLQFKNILHLNSFSNLTVTCIMWIL